MSANIEPNVTSRFWPIASMPPESLPSRTHDGNIRTMPFWMTTLIPFNASRTNGTTTMSTIAMLLPPTR